MVRNIILQARKTFLGGCNRNLDPFWGIYVSIIQDHTTKTEQAPAFGQYKIIKDHPLGNMCKKKGPLLKKLGPVFGIICGHRIFSIFYPLICMLVRHYAVKIGKMT